MMKAFFVLCFAVACGAPVATVNAPVKTSRAELDRFLADEDRVLVVMAAADPRIAARGVTVDAAALQRATMGGILAEDWTMAMEGDRPDVLSFDVRTRALAAATEIMAHWKLPPANPDPGSPLRPGLEVELLQRFLASEKLRLENERDLPRSAAELFGALATTWRAPTLKEISGRDDWLSRRFLEVKTALASHAISITALERDDLDDALDPLERTIDGLPKSRAALVELRLAVQAAQPAPKSSDRWDAIAPRLSSDVGTHLSADTLLGLLQTSAKMLRAEIDQLIDVKVTDERITKASELLTMPSDACAKAEGSRVRALQPPAERAFECVLRAHVIAARTADENLDVLIAMHEAVTVAAWAVVMARGGGVETMALAAPKMLGPLSPTIEGKLMRFAATRPVTAIARALSVEWIMRNGLGEAALRANAWTKFGDAPLDVIERELHPRKLEQGHLHQERR